MSKIDWQKELDRDPSDQINVWKNLYELRYPQTYGGAGKIPSFATRGPVAVYTRNGELLKGERWLLGLLDAGALFDRFEHEGSSRVYVGKEMVPYQQIGSIMDYYAEQTVSLETPKDL